MGYKIFTVIITPKPEVQYATLLGELGFQNLKKIRDEAFGSVMNPPGGKVYIGTYNNNLLICASELADSFFEKRSIDGERLLIEKFPDREICVLVLHSVVNLWGYAILKQGKKIRARAGSADDGTFLEFGEPIEEEMDLLSKSSFDAEGKRVYKLSTDPDDVFTEDQVGENFVFALCYRYLGEELDAAENPLYETVMTGYSFAKMKKQGGSDDLENKPWWKFW